MRQFSPRLARLLLTLLVLAAPVTATFAFEQAAQAPAIQRSRDVAKPPAASISSSGSERSKGSKAPK